jgi:hypothetical protein
MGAAEADRVFKRPQLNLLAVSIEAEKLEALAVNETEVGLRPRALLDWCAGWDVFARRHIGGFGANDTHHRELDDRVGAATGNPLIVAVLMQPGVTDADAERR